MEGFARPAPVAGPAVPISNPTIEYAAEVKPGKPDMGLLPQTAEETAIKTAQTTGNGSSAKANEIIAAFQNGDITAEEAVAKLMAIGITEPDAVQMVWDASDAGQQISEWVDDAWSPMADALQGVGSSEPSIPISTPEIEVAPTDDEEETVVSRAFTQDQKYALVGLLVMGLLATYYKRR